MMSVGWRWRAALERRSTLSTWPVWLRRCDFGCELAFEGAGVSLASSILCRCWSVSASYDQQAVLPGAQAKPSGAGPGR